MLSKSSGCKLIFRLFLRCSLICLMKAIGVTCLYSWNSSISCSLENPLFFISCVQPRVWSKFSVIQTHNSSSLLALEAFSGDRFFVVERMRFSKAWAILNVKYSMSYRVFPWVEFACHLPLLYKKFYLLDFYQVSSPPELEESSQPPSEPESNPPRSGCVGESIGT